MGENVKTARPVDYGLLVLLGVLLGIPYALTKISQTTIPPLTGVAISSIDRRNCALDLCPHVEDKAIDA